MAHKEYIKEVKDSSTAVIFTHGIMGTPDQFRDLLPLVPKEFSVYNLLLPGHGQTPKDFSDSSMQEWEQKLCKTVEYVESKHENIILVGHSMGTLLSIDAALKHPNKVKLLFLQAVPLTPRVKPEAVRYAHAILFKDEKDYTYAQAQAKASYSISVERDPKKYLGWPRRFEELFRKAYVITKKLPCITTRCIAFQSGEDELVSGRAEKILRKHPNIITHTLSQSTHYMYSEDDKEFMLRVFREECEKFIEK